MKSCVFHKDLGRIIIIWKLITTQHENRLYCLGRRYYSLQREAFLNPGTKQKQKTEQKKNTTR